MLSSERSDNAHGRDFAYQAPDNQTLTVEECVEACKTQGYTLAGAEYSGQFPLIALLPQLRLTDLASAMLLR